MSHRQDKQLRDGWMKPTALFARLNVLLSDVVLVQKARCEDEDDDWVAARMLSHTQSISSSAASPLLRSMYLFPFSFSNFLRFTMSLQRCLTTLVELLYGEFTLRCGVHRRGFLPLQLFENAFEVNGDSLQSFHKRTDLKETCDDFPQVIRFVLHGKQSGLHKLYIVHSNIHSSRVSKR